MSAIRRIHTGLLICLVVLGTVLYLLSLALGPRVSQATIDKENLWLQNIYLSPHFGISLNLDSYYYLISANDTRIIFAHENYLQSRPLMSFIASPLARLIGTVPLGSLPGATPQFNSLLPAYLAYIFLNLTILILCYWCYASIVLPMRDGRFEWQYGVSTAPTAFVIGGLLVVNEVTKAFFFAAHVQMMNLLVPLVALGELLYLCNANLRLRTYVLHAILAGLAMLAYGSVVVVGMTIILSRVYGYSRSKRFQVWKMMAEVAFLFVILMVPYFGWQFFVILMTGKFYNHEVVHWQQVVWMLDVFDKGWKWLISALASNVVYFLVSALQHLVASIPLVLLLLVFSWPHRAELRLRLKSDAFLFIGAAVIATLFIGFFSLVGYRVTRLAMPAAVMVIVILGMWAARLDGILGVRQRWLLSALAGAVLAGEAAWMVAKDGPYY